MLGAEGTQWGKKAKDETQSLLSENPDPVEKSRSIERI